MVVSHLGRPDHRETADGFVSGPVGGVQRDTNKNVLRHVDGARKGNVDAKEGVVLPALVRGIGMTFEAMGTVLGGVIGTGKNLIFGTRQGYKWTQKGGHRA